MKFIVNCILVILIAHFLLKKLSFNTNDVQYRIDHQLPQNINTQIHNMISQQQQPIHSQQKQNIDISASNYYTHGNNTPNFKSNIMATPKYYTYNEEGRTRGGPYYEHFSSASGTEKNEEDGELKQRVDPNNTLVRDVEGQNNYGKQSEETNAWLESDAVQNIKEMESKSNLEQVPETEGVSSMKEQFTSFQSPGTNDTDVWQYSNELAMNGGNLGIQGMDVYGNQSLNSMYASIGATNTVLSGCDPYSSENMKDDIRFGMGVGNEKNMLQR
jgi:hypothetical protein